MVVCVQVRVTADSSSTCVSYQQTSRGGTCHLKIHSDRAQPAFGGHNLWSRRYGGTDSRLSENLEIKTTQAKCFCLASEADGDVSVGRERSEEGGNRKVVKATTLLLSEASAKL